MGNSTALTISENNIDSYMAEVSRHPLLTRDEEMSLAYAYRDEGDVSAAHRMVVGNLRFVVKIAHEYRHYGFKKLDLIQEGNIGLMMAVKKFDPDRGYRLISYAVWWIRAQIQSFIQRSWSMVKVGMTGARRKLFFKLRSERALLEKNALPGEKPTNAAIVMAGRDFSLDTRLTDDSGTSHLDLLADENVSQEEYVAQLEEHQMVREKLAEVAAESNEKEQYIIEHRLLDEEPMSLQEIGTHFGVSRERIRQLESRVMGKLKTSLEELRNTSTKPGLKGF